MTSAIVSCGGDKVNINIPTPTTSETDSGLKSNIPSTPGTEKSAKDLSPSSLPKESLKATMVQEGQEVKDDTKMTVYSKNKSVQPAVEKKKSIPKKKKITIPPKKKDVIKKRYANISFEQMSYDFGEITEGDVINHKFVFTNTSNVPLEIKSAKATCGCTHPNFPFITIAPGESNQIGVTYHSVNKDGEQTPEITIEANTQPTMTILKLHGTVTPKPVKENKEVAEVTEEESKENLSKKDTTTVKSSKQVTRIVKDKSTKISIKKDTVR